MAMDAVYKTSGVGNKILDPDIKELLENDGIDEFTSMCGDSMINSSKMGAILLVDAAFEFSNSASREEFETKAGGSFIFGSASASVNKI